MECLIYVSEALVSARSREATGIYLDARRRNRDLAVTGYLHREAGYYAQYLEGEAVTLDPLLQKLWDDWRHRNLDIRLRQSLGSRRFPAWDMAFSEAPYTSYADFAAARELAGSLSGASGPELLAFFESIATRGGAAGR